MNQMAIRDLKKVARNVQEAKNSFFYFLFFFVFFVYRVFQSCKLHDAITFVPKKHIFLPYLTKS